jgi:hypothetical protein
LEKGIPPQTLHGQQFSPTELGITGTSDKIEVYDPWKDVWATIEKTGTNFTLPDFQRSIVARVRAK